VNWLTSFFVIVSLGIAFLQFVSFSCTWTVGQLMRALQNMFQEYTPVSVNGGLKFLTLKKASPLGGEMPHVKHGGGIHDTPSARHWSHHQ